MGSEVYRGLAEPHIIYIIHFEETRTFKVGVTRHDGSRLTQHVRRQGAKQVAGVDAPNKYAAQIVEGLVLREVRVAQVFVEDPLNGGTEHWDDRLNPPSLDLLLASQAGEHRDSEWSRTVWRLESGPGEKFRALQTIAQRVEASSDAAVRERIQRIEGATNSWEYAVASAIDDSREMAGRALVRLADEGATGPGSEAETLAEQVGQHSAIAKGLERYRRDSRRTGRDRRANR
ncbi:hypothetical protein [Microbacterium sp. lyk4-40-TSB-66]|uniref:hypothetical protein n=1 Tax=Microbacterium sp. lyk4-40-TSB-66 TaxID=3040294 RepID=UPI00254D067A|nr:hypothetical protein [Microbacterium sp. lyk4-40-TSB-66]